MDDNFLINITCTLVTKLLRQSTVVKWGIEIKTKTLWTPPLTLQPTLSCCFLEIV